MRVWSKGCSASVADIISRKQSQDCNNICTASEVTGRSPLRISSSSVSTPCVKLATSMKPNVAEPPLMECAARKMVLMFSRSAVASRLNSPDSMMSSPSRLS